jgi:hypothetical protein
MGGLRPVVTTTGKGYASPPGLRKSKDLGNSQRLEKVQRLEELPKA